MSIAARQRRFQIGVYLLLDERPSKAYESHLSKATGFKVTVTRLHPFSFSPVEKRGPPGLEAKSHVKARSWILVDRGNQRHMPYWALLKKWPLIPHFLYQPWTTNLEMKTPRQFDIVFNVVLVTPVTLLVPSCIDLCPSL